MNLLTTFVLLNHLNTTFISRALSDAINELFVEKLLQFDIIIYGEKTNKITNIIDEIEKLNEGKFTSKIQIYEPFKWDHKLNISAVILAETFSHIKYMSTKVKLTQEFYNPIRFITYYENGNAEDFNQRFLYGAQSTILQFGYYLIETENLLTLYSIEWFTKKFCMRRQFVGGNSFDKNLGRWNKYPVIVPKFKNYHGCIITKMVEYYKDFTYENAYGNFDGVLIELIDGMAGKGNFIAEFVLLDTEMLFAEYMQMNLVISTNSDTLKYGHIVSYFLDETISFLLSPSESFSSYEKLFLPFDETTWILTLVVFLYAFLTIPTINMLSEKLQVIIYGKFVSTPAFNVIGTFFGIGQQTLPDDNFPRILLMTFIIFCLIIRTAYQSLLFEYVAIDIRKPVPSTIDELVQNNYTIVAPTNFYDRVKDQLKDENR